MSASTASVLTSDKSEKLHRWRIVSNVAVALLVAVTSLWTYWGVAEMYYEGWWGEWTNRLGYLIPGAAFLLLSLLIIRWPRFGGWLLILLGGGFTAFYWSIQFSRWGFSWEALLTVFPISGLLVLLGVFFVLAGRAQRSYPLFKTTVETGNLAFVQQNWRCLLAVGLPLLVAIVVSATNLPIILARIDDGDRGAQLVAGNGVTLVWAPAGPGWGRGMQRADQEDFNQPGAVLSWNEIALYGRSPIGITDKPGFAGLACDSSSDAGCATQADMTATGLCRYLSADGLRLLDEPQDIWRMPTVDEMVHSLARHGEIPAAPGMVLPTGLNVPSRQTKSRRCGTQIVRPFTTGQQTNTTWWKPTTSTTTATPCIPSPNPLATPVTAIAACGNRGRRN